MIFKTATTVFFLIIYGLCSAQTDVDTALLNRHLNAYEIDFSELMGVRGMSASYQKDLEKSGTPQFSTLQRLAKIYGKTSSILFYSFDNDTLHSWLVRSEKIYHGKEKTSADELLSLEQQFLSIIQSGELMNLRGGKVTSTKTDTKVNEIEIRKRLNKLLFPDGIQKGIQETKNLIILPILNISKLPLYLLNPYDDQTLLIDRFAISFAHSFQHLIEKTNYLSGEEYVGYPRRFSMYGMSKFENCDKFIDLPGVELEYDKVGNIFKSFNDTLTLYDLRSTTNLDLNNRTKTELIEELKLGASKNKYINSVLYFATHGVSSMTNSMDSNYLVFNNCTFLTEREIQYLPLNNSCLVVLSACQTGLGKSLDAGTLSLGKAFLKAKAGNVVYSLWSVDDASTALLMSYFAEELTFLLEYDSDGVMPAIFYPALQLRNAMLRFRMIDPDPNHWAAFVSMGTPVVEMRFE